MFRQWRDFPILVAACAALTLLLLVLSLVPGTLIAASLSRFQHGSTTHLGDWFELKIIPDLRVAATGMLLVTALGVYGRKSIGRMLDRLVSAIERADAIFLAGSRGAFGVPHRYLLFWLAVSSVTMLALFFPTLAHGYFQYDDFEILSVARTHFLWQAIFMTHGDHTMPLMRVEVSTMMALFGVHAWYYNALLLALFILILFFGALLLRELGVGNLAAGLFIVFVTGWMLWSEILTGYYALSIYSQQLFLSLIACWAYRRWRSTHRARYSWIVAVALFAAPMMDISGFWVLAAALVFVVSDCIGEAKPRLSVSWLRENAWFFCAFAGATLFALAFNAYVFMHLPTGSFLSMGQSEHLSPFQTLQEIWYYVAGGVLLSPVLPVGYWKLPAPTLISLLLAITLACFVLAIYVGRRFPRRVSSTVLAGTVIILGNATMVALGRAQSGFSFPWQTKYIGNAYVWYILVASLVVNEVWNLAQHRNKVVILQLCIVATVFFFCVQAASSFTAKAFSKNAIGYKALLADTDLRREGVEALRLALAPTFQSASVPTIPMLTGNFIEAQYPGLFQYDMVCYRDFILPAGRHVRFIQNTAMNTYLARARDGCSQSRKGLDGVDTVGSLRAQSSAAFIRNLQTNLSAQRLYLSGIKLEVHENSCFPNPSHRDAIIHSDGFMRQGIREGGWDPETYSLLKLDIAYSGPQPFARILLHFGGDLGVAYHSNWIEIPAGQRTCLSSSLLQLYSYALSGQVHDLVAQYETPGAYHVYAMTLEKTPR